jgi:hypothetical protein
MDFLLKIIESLLLKNTTLRRAFKDLYGILKYIFMSYIRCDLPPNKFLQHKFIFLYNNNNNNNEINK